MFSEYKNSYCEQGFKRLELMFCRMFHQSIRRKSLLFIQKWFTIWLVNKVLYKHKFITSQNTWYPLHKNTIQGHPTICSYDYLFLWPCQLASKMNRSSEQIRHFGAWLIYKKYYFSLFIRGLSFLAQKSMLYKCFLGPIIHKHVYGFV